ncbi:hypothetical protein M2389_000958 [Microbacterium phyllosphaerae]|nr:hypothetical protein [Microbacterium phyllosphaerae]
MKPVPAATAVTDRPTQGLSMETVVPPDVGPSSGVAAACERLPVLRTIAAAAMLAAAARAHRGKVRLLSTMRCPPLSRRRSETTCHLGVRIYAQASTDKALLAAPFSGNRVSASIPSTSVGILVMLPKADAEAGGSEKTPGKEHDPRLTQIVRAVLPVGQYSRPGHTSNTIFRRGSTTVDPTVVEQLTEKRFTAAPCNWSSSQRHSRHSIAAGATTRQAGRKTTAYTATIPERARAMGWSAHRGCRGRCNQRERCRRPHGMARPGPGTGA